MDSKEKTLAEQCRRGDASARRRLYEEHAGWMFGVCLRYVARRSVAEDLLHDAFIAVFTGFGQFEWRGEGSLKAWLFRVVQNTVLQHLRRNKVVSDTVPLAPDMAFDEPPTAADIPHEALLQLIAELPAGYRAVFNMYVVDGLSHKAIAAALGIKEKSSSSQLLHARRLLAKKIIVWRKENL